MPGPSRGGGEIEDWMGPGLAGSVSPHRGEGPHITAHLMTMQSVKNPKRQWWTHVCGTGWVGEGEEELPWVSGDSSDSHIQTGFMMAMGEVPAAEKGTGQWEMNGPLGPGTGLGEH